MSLHHHHPTAHETTMLLKPTITNVTTTTAAEEYDQQQQRLHHRHPHVSSNIITHPEIDEERQSSPLSGDEDDDEEEEEDSPLAFPNDENDDNNGYSPSSNKHHFHHHHGLLLSSKRQKGICCLLVLAAIVAVAGYWYLVLSASSNQKKNDQSNLIIPVDQALETLLNVTDPESGQTFQIWFRTWGRMDLDTAIPIVFIHGGPGNAIADYFGNSNQRFFQNQNHNFFVVEVDQRGTGKSQPSVRDDIHNMQYYADISIDKLCTDFEAIRLHLNIEKWLVWGGSFGSTLAINYGQRYPESCLALIIRGIYLDTVEEVYAIYSRQNYLNNTKRLHEFDILYDYAADYYSKKQTTLVASTKNTSNKNDQDSNNHSLTTLPLDPNNAEQLLRVYAEMIANNGDIHAVWHWFVFENNLMETDPAYILNPYEIDEEFYPESQSVAFFETHLWLHGSFEKPTSNLMDAAKIHRLNMPLWICQGQYDEVCPPRYAQAFVNAMTKAGQSPWIVSRFLNGSHEDTDPAIAFCLKQSLREFVDYHHNQDDDDKNMYNLAW